MTQEPYGLMASRYLKCLAIAAKSEPAAGLAFAESQAQWTHHRSMICAVLRTAVPNENAHDIDTNVLSQGRTFQADFAMAVRQQTVIGRLLGLRKVPVNTPVALSSDATTAYWSGEGKPIPVTRDQLLGVQLRPVPVAAISVVTEELVNAIGFTAETMLGASLINASARAIDLAFLDPSNAGVADKRPASIAAGASPIVASAVTPAAIDTALQAAIAGLTAAHSDLQYAAWACSATTATRLASVRGSGGAAAYPDITANGGSLLGLPVLTSPSAPNGALELIDGAAVTMADDNATELSVTDSASIDMRDTPEGGTPVWISLFQTESLGLKAVRHLFWKMGLPGRVQLVTGIGGA